MAVNYSEENLKEIGELFKGINPEEVFVFPASFAQQRLWLVDRLSPPNALYSNCNALVAKGHLNMAALEQSFKEIKRRHETLRTQFTAINGEPVQVIIPDYSLTLPVIDLSALPPDRQTVKVQQLIADDIRKPFDLKSDSLFRTSVFKLSEQEYWLTFIIHHIISDGWSADVMIRELAVLYEAFSRGNPSPLPPLAVQYADFTIYQKDYLQGTVLEKLVNYWQGQLNNLTVLELPSDRPRPAVETFRGATESLALPTALTKAVKTLGQQEGTTFFMTLLAVFKTLLYRYTQQEDIAIGSPIANRNLKQTEDLIGFFVNTLVLRSDLSGNPTFRELLKRVREVTLEAYTHQDLPFEKLVEVLQPERDLSRQPLVQVEFVLQNAPVSEVKFSNLTLKKLPAPTGTAKNDLTLYLEENTVLEAKTDSELFAVFEYNTDLFDASTIQRMAGHFQTLLESIVANPDSKIWELPLLTEKERTQLLIEWNDTRIDSPEDKCIHQLFEEQVERTPNAVAVVFEREQLTYQQLNQRANQLAGHLIQLGVGPDVLVGLCIERSLEMIVGLLAILKAGGAYVPIDPAYPGERISFILEDAAVSVLLTQQSLVETLPLSTAKLLCLDALGAAVALESEKNPNSGAIADNLAYIIYTSGTTGKPKGVLLNHRGLCNLATTQSKLLQVGGDSRFLQFASLSFDVSISEIFITLTSGASLYLARRESLIPGLQLIQLLRDRGITHADLPPSALAVMPEAELPSLQVIIVGGEACPPDLAEKWSPGRRFFNAYGPTESTVSATIAEYNPNSHSQKLPIGRAIANTQVYILDRHLQPIPVGIPGELYIGGVGLARGYLNRPELTEQRFIPHPFSDKAGVRLYRSGDLGRYLPDGNIEFLGRIDNQVKIRGYRIELGEIEAALQHHPQVREAVVIAKEIESGDKRLLAYVVSRSPTQFDFAHRKLTGDELRRALRESLPEYMVPSAFVLLETMPLTSSGKIDRSALPDPDKFRLQTQTERVMPQTKTEQAIAAVWQELLQVEKIGINENFFDLGGHSLLLVKVQFRLQEVLGIEIAVADLFKYSTIQALAQYLTEKPDSSSFVERRDRVTDRTQRQTSIQKERDLRRKLRSKR